MTIEQRDDSVLGYAEHLSYLGTREIRDTFQFTDIAHLFVRKFSSRVCAKAACSVLWHCIASLCVAISVVISFGSEKQMRNIDTGRIIARVKHALMCWIMARLNEVREPMSSPRVCRSPHLPISVNVLGTKPRPTFIILVLLHVLPEVVKRYWGYQRHGFILYHGFSLA